MINLKPLRSLVSAVAAISLVGCTSIADQQVRANSGEIKPIWIVNKSYTKNYVDGVQVDMSIINLSPKTIKYATLYVMPFNPVGEVIASEIGGKSLAEVEIVGPFEPSHQANYSWQNVWYHSVFDCYEIERIEIEYMDSTELVLKQSEVSKILMDSTKKLISNSCT
tara:strand:+ start:87 stop:584 length:498 start_codon:yes stop_codon:yes gene_type:complete